MSDGPKLASNMPNHAGIVRRIAALCVIGLLSATVLVGEASAQARPRGRGLRALPRIDVSGKFVAIRQGLLQIVGEDGKKVLVKLDPRRTVVQVTGPAEADVLRAGMFVEFLADLDKKGTAQDEIKKLLVFEPSELIPPGVTPELDGPDAAAAAGSETPSSADEAATKRFRVRAKIKTVGKTGKIQLTTAHGPVNAQLAEDIEITLDVSNLNLGRKDDAVRVKGRLAQPGQVIAESVSIELAEPYTNAKKKSK